MMQILRVLGCALMGTALREYVNPYLFSIALVLILPVDKS
jgi:hypothetical protein